MSDMYERRAANIIAPAVSKIAAFTATTTDLVATLSETTTTMLGEVVTRGDYITIAPEGGDLYCYFSSTGDATPAGTVASGVGVDSTRAWKIPNGEERHFRIQSDTNGLKTKLFHLASAAATVVRVYVSSAITTRDDGNPTGS